MLQAKKASEPSYTYNKEHRVPAMKTKASGSYNEEFFMTGH